MSPDQLTQPLGVRFRRGDPKLGLRVNVLADGAS